MLVKLAKRFPKRYAKMNHDFVGLMVNKLPKEVHRIMLCLDFDASLIKQVEEFKPDLIMTHHPFIYGPKHIILRYNMERIEVYNKMLENGTPIYSMHTNFDTGKGGMNDALSEALGLKNVYAPEKDICMRIGELEHEMDVVEFAKFAKEQFKVEYSLLINEGNKTIKKVGIIGGGGSRRWDIAKEEGCDIYISGDAPHYVRRDVVNAHYNYLDMPHEIEKIFMPQMKKILLEMDPNLEILIVDHEQLPKVI